MTDTQRTPLIVISGLSPGPARSLAEQLRGTGDDQQGTAVVHHDLRQIASGVVLRHVRLGPRESLTTLELAHGCVSCTLREDLLPLLRRLAGDTRVRRIVLRLDEAMEPEQVCWAMHHVLVGDSPVIDDVEIEAVATVLDAATWLDDVTGDEAVTERGIPASPDDERTVAQVALAQAEFADVLVLASSPSDAWSAAKTGAVLARAAPAAPVVELAGLDSTALLAAVPAHARRGMPDDPHGALLRGEPPLHTDCGVTVVPFSARRPFHPERLHDAIDVLLDGVVRTRGRVWVASQPDVALWLESAGGGLGIGHLGPWLDSPAGPGWDEIPAERRTLASLRWDPVFGDRAQELVVITHDAEPHDIETALTGALLTDDELAEGRDRWLHYPDPFGEWHSEPCEDTERTDTSTSTTTGGNEE